MERFAAMHEFLEVCHMGHRSAHYFLWFILFGLIAGAASLFSKDHSIASSEAIWLLVSGVLGILVTQKWLNDGKFAQIYDFIIGVIFTLVGLVGVLQIFAPDLVSGLGSLPGGLVTKTTIIGLSLGLLPGIVHLVLGLQSLNHGLRSGK
jgi:hypothetical protein